MRRLIASWFGSGLILGAIRGSHQGSGTVGAILAFFVSIFIGETLGSLGQTVALITVTAAGMWASAPFVAEEGDAGWIVVDEAAGTFLALLGLTLSPPALVAFVVFRMADVFKEGFPGVAAAETIGGSLGITADDLVAGLYGLAAGHAVRLLL